MKIAFLLLLALSITPPSPPVLDADHARELARAFQLEGVANVVQGKAREMLTQMLGAKMGDWAAEGLIASAKKAGVPLLNGRLSMIELNQKDKNLSQEIKIYMQQKLQESFPRIVHQVIQEGLLQGVLSEADQKYFQTIETKIETLLNTSFNDQAHDLLSGMYDRCVRELLAGWSDPFSPLRNLEELRQTAVAFLNQGGAVALISNQLAEQLGNATVQGFQQNMLTLLRGELPEEVLQAMELGPDKFSEYVEKVKPLLPGAQFEKIKAQIFQLPVFNMPNEVYGGILAARAAEYCAEFATSCSGFFATCDWALLERCREVTQTMIAQLKNKQAVSISVGDLFDLSQLAGKLGIKDWGVWDKISKGNPLGEWRAKLDGLESKLKKVDEWYDKNSGKLTEDLKNGVKDLEGDLTEFSNQLLDPIRKANAEWTEKLKVLEKIPPLKLPKIQIPEKIFGKEGDKTPKQVLTEVFHPTGPTPEIKPEEKIPAQHPSQDSDFDPVLLHNGEFFYKATDVTIPGRRLPFQFTRIYRSRSDFVGVLGHGWTTNWEMRLLPWQEGFTYINEEGKKFFFAPDGHGGFQSPAGLFATLEKNTIIFSDGTKNSFNESGRLTSVEDRFGNRFQCQYNDKEQLITVIDTAGRPIHFQYNDQGLMSALEDFGGRRWQYSYDKQGHLIGATTPALPDFPKGKTTGYRYANNKLILIMDPKGQIYLQNYYGESGDDLGRVIKQIYGPEGVSIQARYFKNTVLIEDRRGTWFRYIHNEAGQLIEKDWVKSGKEMEVLERHEYPLDEKPMPPKASENISFNDWGLPAKKIDPLGRVDLWDYSSEGNLLEKVEDAEGLRAVTQYEYDIFGNIVAITDPNGNTRRFAVNVLNEITQEMLPLGTERNYSYDANDNLVKMNVAPGIVHTFDYGPLDRLTKKREQVSSDHWIETKFDYDPQGNPIQKIFPEGNFIRMEYDPLGRRVRQTEGLPSLEARGESWEYDLQNHLLKSCDSLAHCTHFEYDDAGHLSASVNPLGLREEWKTDASGRMLSHQTHDIAGNLLSEEKFSYGPNNEWVEREQLLWRDAPNRGKWVKDRWEYDAKGRWVATIDPAGARWEKKYDALDRIIETKNPLGEKVLYRYDWVGNLIAIEKNDAIWHFTYDALKRLLEMIDPSGAKTKFQYNAFNAVTQITDAEGKIIQYQYDDIGRIVATLQGAQTNAPATTRWEWDGNGRLIGLTDANGKSTRYDYDALDRLVREQMGEENEWLYSYNDADRLVGLKNGKGEWVQLRYDAAGQLLQRSGKDLDQEFAYDPLGRLIRGKDKKEIVQWRYDSLARPMVENVDGTSVETVWDMGGNPATLHTPDATNLFKSFDLLGRAQTVFADDHKIAQWSYERGMPKQLDMGGVAKIEFGYDLMDRLSSQKWEVGGSPWRQENYRYNGNSQVIEEGANSYQYDFLNRLASLPLDPVGNRTDHKDLQYDANGNLVADPSFQYEYDGLDRLITVHSKEAGDLIANYQYDVLGRRTEKFLAKENKIIRYRYDGWNLIEAKEVGGATRQFFYGEGLDDLLGMTVKNGEKIERYYYLKDRIGSVIGLVDEAGRVVEQPEQVGNIFGFASREVDAETGLMNFRNRYYSPALGEFITRDPLGNKNAFYAASNVGAFFSFSYHRGAGGASRATFANHLETDLFYPRNQDWTDPPEMATTLYARGDPVNWYDPWGLFSMVAQLPNQRDHAGIFYLFGEDKKTHAGPYPILGRSSNTWHTETGALVHNANTTRNPLFPFGDTPTGLYQVGRAEPRSNFTKYGPSGVVPLDPIFDEAQTAENNGRKGFLIHGGGADSKYKFDGLTSTQGCLRLSDENMAQLVAALQDLRAAGDNNGTLLVREKPLSFFRER